MQHFSVPVCYFPTTALFVDDNREFLLNFVLQLDERLAYHMYDSPFEALKCVRNKRFEIDMLSQRCLSEYTEAKNCPLTNQTVNLDLAAIHAEIYNPHRFSEITVAVVDYAMPGMDGLDFCRNIAHASVKKILLTGQAEEKLAIQAFNEGIIHRYIQKNDPNVTERINQSIKELQWQYFKEMSDMIVRMLSVASPNCLQDKIFTDFFTSFCVENNIVEHYLADNSGSFLLLDEHANVSYLLVKSVGDCLLHYDLARDSGASSDVLKQLKTGEKIPLFWQTTTLNSPWNVWSNNLISANRLQGDDVYYYAHVKNPELFDLNDHKIKSFHGYLENVDAEALLTP